MTTPVEPEEDSRASGLGLAALVAAIIIGFAFLPRLFSLGGGGALAGKDAPDVSFQLVANAPGGGGDVSLSGLRGRPVLLDFWATWCGPCQAEAPVVDRIAQRYRDQGLAVFGVDTSDEKGKAAPFASQHHLTYPIAYDEGQRAATAYGVDNLPTLVVISKAGKVIAVRTGVTSDAELDALIKRVL